MKLLVTKTKFSKYSEEEIEKRENLGHKIDTEEDFEIGNLYINIDQILSFNESENGDTTISMADGRWQLELRFKAFLEALKNINNLEETVKNQE